MEDNAQMSPSTAMSRSTPGTATTVNYTNCIINTGPCQVGSDTNMKINNTDATDEAEQEVEDVEYERGDADRDEIDEETEMEREKLGFSKPDSGSQSEPSSEKNYFKGNVTKADLGFALSQATNESSLLLEAAKLTAKDDSTNQPDKQNISLEKKRDDTNKNKTMLDFMSPVSQLSTSVQGAGTTFPQSRDESEQKSIKLSQMSEKEPNESTNGAIRNCSAYVEKSHGLVLLAMHEEEAMCQIDLLGLCIMYQPNTAVMPHTNEITVGISYDVADYPVMRPGQRRITPVLVCMPHKSKFSSLLSISCPLLCTPLPDTNIKVLYSNTDINESVCWQEAHDVSWFLHPNKASFHLNHFCTYCLIEEQRSVDPELRHRIVSIFLRAKPLREELCVEVTVQLTDPQYDFAEPVTGGELMRQEQFPVVNKRPITITLMPRTNGWKVRNDRRKQELYEINISNTKYCPDRSVFSLSTPRTPQNNMDTVDFELRMKQCKGFDLILDLYDSFEDLLKRNLHSTSDNTSGYEQIKLKGNSVADFEQANHSELACARACLSAQASPMATDATVRQMNPASVKQVNGPGASESPQSVMPKQRHTQGASVSSNQTLGEGSCKQSVFDGDVTDEPVSGKLVSDAPVSDDLLPDVSNELVLAKHTADQVLAKFVPRAAHSLQSTTINVIVNNGNHPIRQLDLDSAREWEVSYEICKKIGEHLDLHAKWKMLASKLKFDKAIDGVEQLASNNHASPTEILLREWMLAQNKEDRDTCYQRLIIALTDMDRNDIVDDLEDVARNYIVDEID